MTEYTHTELIYQWCNCSKKIDHVSALCYDTHKRADKHFQHNDTQVLLSKRLTVDEKAARILEYMNLPEEVPVHIIDVDSYRNLFFRKS